MQFRKKYGKIGIKFIKIKKIMGESVKYHSISILVWDDNEIQSALKEWYELLKWVKESWNKELYNKFLKEYKDLRRSIMEAKKDSMIISEKEREKILIELADIITLAEEHNIEEKKWHHSNIWDKIKKTDTEKVREKAMQISLQNKMDQYTWRSLDSLSQEEIIDIFKIFEKKYLAYNTNPPNIVDQRRIDLKYFRNTTIDFDNIWSQYEVRVLQDKLSEKLFEGKDKKFNDTFIQGFNEEKWNHLIKIEDFENRIKNINDFQELNRTWLISYAHYLQSKNTWDELHTFLRNSFWSQKTSEFLDFIGRNSWLSFLSSIKTSFDTFVKNIYTTIINKIQSAQTPKEVTDSLEWIESYPHNEKEIFIKELKETLTTKRNEFKKKFTTHLLWKNYPPEEADEIVEKLFQEIWENLTPEKLWNAYRILKDFNTTYESDFNIQNIIEKVSEVKIFENVKNIQEIQQALEREKDPMKRSFLEQQLQEAGIGISQATTVIAITSALWEQNIQDIATWKKDYNEVLNTIRQQNKELDTYLTKYETEKKAFEEKYPELAKQEASKSEAQHQEIQITTPDTLAYKNTQISYVSSWEKITLNTWNTQIDITQKEFNIVQNNEKALENLINFRTTLDELHLGELWNVRNEIFSSLREKYPILFNENDDFLSEKELLIFLNTLLATLDKKDYASHNLNITKTNIMTLNHASVFWWTNKENQITGDSTLEQKFIKKFCPVEKNKKFQTQAFREVI